jgi:hypothetical protein
LVAAMIAALPAADNVLLGFGSSDGSEYRFDAAHLLRCASPMRFLAAAVIFLRLLFGAAGGVAVSAGRCSHRRY